MAYTGRKRPGYRSMTPRQAAHRLFGTPLDPADDKPPPTGDQKTPSERMSDLMREAAHKHKERPT
jgi:hypothetical protein